MIVCPNCSEKFSFSNRLCKDMRNPKQNLGCPHCEKWLRVKSSPMDIKKTIGILSLIVFICLNNYFIYQKKLYTVHEINIVLVAVFVLVLAFNFFKHGSILNLKSIIKSKDKQNPYEVVPDENEV